VIFKFTFWEEGGWNEPGHEDWARWTYEYKDENKLFDLSGMLNDNKVYVLKYSYSPDINMDTMGVFFFNADNGWEMISDWTGAGGNVKKGEKHSGKSIIIPNDKAAGCNPLNTYLRFTINNRGVSTAPTLSFYEYSIEQVDKQDPDRETWDVSGKEFNIIAETFAELLDKFQGKNDVLHVKPLYGEYSDFVIKYDLSGYAGKTIKIEMSMDVWLNEATWVTWQINSTAPLFYPVVCGTIQEVDPSDQYYDDFYGYYGPVLSANAWHHVTSLPGGRTITVPPLNSGDAGKQLYLSAQQLGNVEMYIADAEITITIIP